MDLTQYTTRRARSLITLSPLGLPDERQVYVLTQQFDGRTGDALPASGEVIDLWTVEKQAAVLRAQLAQLDAFLADCAALTKA